MILIGDKYVNKTDILKEGALKAGEPFAFIRRGSQTDMIFPKDVIESVVPSVEKRLVAGDMLCQK